MEGFQYFSTVESNFKHVHNAYELIETIKEMQNDAYFADHLQCAFIATDRSVEILSS